VKHKRTAIIALVALVLGISTVSAEAANCQGRRDTGTAVGAVGGGVVGNAASHGSLGGTVAGAVIGGVAGNVIAGNNCKQQRYASRYHPRRHYDARGRAFYYDKYGHRHYYRS